MSLEEMRKKIDAVDDQIVRLIAERTRQSQSIGHEKHKSSQPVEDAAREEKVLAHIAAVAREENLDEKEIQRIYRQIIKSSKSVQGVAVATVLARVRKELTARQRPFSISDTLLMLCPVRTSIRFSRWWRREKFPLVLCLSKIPWKGASAASMTSC